MRSAYFVGTRIAMLFEGKVRQVGSVDEIKSTSDPVVRQFIEGRATLHTANLSMDTMTTGATDPSGAVV